MKRIAAVVLSLLCLTSGCASMTASRYREEMARTARIEVNLKVHVYGTIEGQSIDTVVDGGWYGSGTVIAQSHEGKGRSLLLTAAHVSHVPSSIDLGDIPDIHADILSSKMKIRTYDGRTCEAEEVSVDKSSDVATVQAACLFGTPASIADKIPQPGDSVSMAGCPLGVIEQELVTLVEGRFMGVRDGFSEEVHVTLPSTHGFSGSAIYDSSGRIISVLVKGYEGYEELAYGTSLRAIKNVIREGKNKWLAATTR